MGIFNLAPDKNKLFVTLFIFAFIYSFYSAALSPINGSSSGKTS